jgi:hypothetical protein
MSMILLCSAQKYILHIKVLILLQNKSGRTSKLGNFLITEAKNSRNR